MAYITWEGKDFFWNIEGLWRITPGKSTVHVTSFHLRLPICETRVISIAASGHQTGRPTEKARCSQGSGCPVGLHHFTTRESSYLFISVSFAFCTFPGSCPLRFISLLPFKKRLILHRLQIPRDQAGPVEISLIYYGLLSGGCYQLTLWHNFK